MVRRNDRNALAMTLIRIPPRSVGECRVRLRPALHQPRCTNRRLLTRDPIPELGEDVTPVSVRFQASSVSMVDNLLAVGHDRDDGSRSASAGPRP